MHIPDGYLSPLFSLGTGLATVPAWALAVRRVQSMLNNRTIPLLAIFSAFAFAIMMFNVPVPGGTTAHGVGGTLIAIVLGPPAAIIGVSMALIIQALFFGDGGVLAIFANCLNMGVILPVAGYYTYRLIAGNSPVLSTRRVWAAGIGAYVGITVSALAVGVELGLQPILFSENGHAIYSPYGFVEAIPTMLLAHVFGASIVEAIITALGVAYLQKQHPEYLTSGVIRTVFAGPDMAEGHAGKRPIWQAIVAALASALVLLVAAGLITGGGDVAHMFGANWSQVNWSDVRNMLLAVFVIAILLIPLTYLVLPRRMKRIGTAFMTLAILAPLGLIAPGLAYGEGGPDDVKAAFGYIPKGLQGLSNIFSAPLSGYNLPYLNDPAAPLWQAAIGYEISGILGMILLGLGVWGLAVLVRRVGRQAEVLAPQESQTASRSWIP